MSLAQGEAIVNQELLSDRIEDLLRKYVFADNRVNQLLDAYEEAFSLAAQSDIEREREGWEAEAGDLQEELLRLGVTV